MKKIILILVLLVVLVSIFFIGCKKESVIDTITDIEVMKSPMANELQNLYNTLPTPNYGNITLVNREILKFESMEHYDQVHDALYEHYRAWNDLFIATYDTGTEDELDDIVESLNFNENWPLTKFENKYKKDISRTLLENNIQREEEWLGRGGGGSYTSDDITSCPVEQTLLSLYYEFCIGDTICQLRPDGYQILIAVSNIQYLNVIRNLSIDELLLNRGLGGIGDGWIPIDWPPSIIIPPSDPWCYYSDYQKEFWGNNGTDYKFKLTYHFRERWNDYKKKTTVTSNNYKKKNNEWKKDYGSQCRLGFSTNIHTWGQGLVCYDKGWGGKTGNISKAFSKSKSKVFDSMTYTDNINNSYITYRHRGIEFKFNAKGISIP